MTESGQADSTRPRKARGICLAYLDQTKRTRWLGLTARKQFDELVRIFQDQNFKKEKKLRDPVKSSQWVPRSGFNEN
jgi:hypothetical protein